MRGFACLVPAVLLALAATPAPVSDPVGVYAMIDRVVFEPDEESPERVQVWGVFSVALPNTIVVSRHPNGTDRPSAIMPRDAFHSARRGYMYYALDPANREQSLAEWQDVKSIAGTGLAVAWGTRRLFNGRIRPPRDKATDADTWPIGIGVITLGNLPWPAYEARRVPAPLAPADGATVPAGSVRLVTRIVGAGTAKYVFEIREGDGPAEASEPVSAIDTAASWTPKMQVRAGHEYTWRVRAVWPEYVSQPAEMKFIGDGRILERR